jgi:hypothetical protein
MSDDTIERLEVSAAGQKKRREIPALLANILI